MKINLLSKLKSSRGFTLIELLIVIAIIGVLAAGLLVLLDPIDKINSANDSKVQSDISSIGRAADAYATSHDGNYPDSLATLQTSGEIKRTPTAPTGYTYTFTPSPGGCSAACTSIVMSGTLKSKKYTLQTPTKILWKFDSITGKNCAVNLVSDVCP